MNALEYKLKVKNEDFEVTEVPLIPHLLKNGPYTYIWLKKSGFSTFDAQDKLKDFFKLRHEDINAEGLKDEDGITSQIISIKKVLTNGHLKLFNKKHSGKIGYIFLERIMGYGKVPVAEKMLHGNSFNITVRNLKHEAALKIEKYCKKNKFFCFINYYDSQRFGIPGGKHNTHLIGKAITENDWEEAYRQFKISKNTGLPKNSITKREDPGEILRSLNPKKLSFFVSSHDSYHWNQELSFKLEKTCKGVRHVFKNVGNLFVPEGNTFTAINIFSCKGNKLEKDLSVSVKDNTRSAFITTAIYVLGIEDDDIHKNREKIKLTFFLPTGGYATMCIRQLIYKSTV